MQISFSLTWKSVINFLYLINHNQFIYKNLKSFFDKKKTIYMYMYVGIPCKKK